MNGAVVEVVQVEPCDKSLHVSGVVPSHSYSSSSSSNEKGELNSDQEDSAIGSSSVDHNVNSSALVKGGSGSEGGEGDPASPGGKCSVASIPLQRDRFSIISKSFEDRQDRADRISRLRGSLKIVWADDPTEINTRPLVTVVEVECHKEFNKLSAYNATFQRCCVIM